MNALSLALSLARWLNVPTRNPLSYPSSHVMLPRIHRWVACLIGSVHSEVNRTPLRSADSRDVQHSSPTASCRHFLNLRPTNDVDNLLLASSSPVDFTIVCYQQADPSANRLALPRRLMALTWFDCPLWPARWLAQRNWENELVVISRRLLTMFSVKYVSLVPRRRGRPIGAFLFWSRGVWPLFNV